MYTVTDKLLTEGVTFIALSCFDFTAASMLSSRTAAGHITVVATDSTSVVKCVAVRSITADWNRVAVVVATSAINDFAWCTGDLASASGLIGVEQPPRRHIFQTSPQRRVACSQQHGNCQHGQHLQGQGTSSTNSKLKRQQLGVTLDDTSEVPAIFKAHASVSVGRCKVSPRIFRASRWPCLQCRRSVAIAEAAVPCFVLIVLSSGEVRVS